MEAAFPSPFQPILRPPGSHQSHISHLQLFLSLEDRVFLHGTPFRTPSGLQAREQSPEARSPPSREIAADTRGGAVPRRELWVRHSACVQAARPSQRCLPGCWAARRAHGGRISGAAWGGVELQHQLLLQVNLHWVPAPITGLEGGASPRPLSSVLGGRSAGSAWFGADHDRSSGR